MFHQGRIYLCTDVHDLFEWMVNSFDGEECKGLFRKLSDEEMVLFNLIHI